MAVSLLHWVLLITFFSQNNCSIWMRDRVDDFIHYQYRFYHCINGFIWVCFLLVICVIYFVWILYGWCRIFWFHWKIDEWDLIRWDLICSQWTFAWLNSIKTLTVESFELFNDVVWGLIFHVQSCQWARQELCPI